MFDIEGGVINDQHEEVAKDLSILRRDHMTTRQDIHMKIIISHEKEKINNIIKSSL